MIHDPVLSELGTRALEYARERGWHVFPLTAGSKVTIKDTRGHLEGTTDEAQIVRWWTEMPNANIGLHLAASGLVAIDPDTYKPECEWHQFIAGRDLPDTLVQSTPSGGTHYIFQADTGADYAGTLCKAVEIKHKGYIVLEPSRVGGKQYRFENDDDPAPCPAWVPMKAASGPGKNQIDTGERRDNTERLFDLLSGMSAHDNSRDLAASLISQGVPANATTELVKAAIMAGLPPGKRRDDRLARVEYHVQTAVTKFAPGAPTFTDAPVDLWGQFEPPVLPAALLPPLIEDFARVQGERMGADPAGLAVAALVTCAAAITDNIKLKVKRHDEWFESARIWAALVGSPSTKKSPILSAATGPLCRIDGQMFRDWQKAFSEWSSLDKAEQRAVPKPVQTRVRIEDATVEAAQMVLEGSPDGALMLQDELSGFFGAMDKYNGGKGASADRAFWLRSFNGGEYALNRVGRGAALIPNLSVSLLGGIQPEPIRKVASDTHDDGLLQRLFPIVLRPATMGKDEPAPDVVSAYRALIERLHTLRPLQGFTPWLEFDDGAQEVRRRLEAEHLRLQSSEAISRKLASHVGKYDGLFARLCIVWHCIEHAEAATMPQRVSKATAERVAGFLHEFLLRHAFAFYGGILGLSDDHDRLTAIASYILAHKKDEVRNRDVQQSVKVMRGLSENETRPLFEQLAALGWLERVPGPRPSSPPVWIVNPEVHRLFGARANAERARREEARAVFAELAGGQ